MSVLQKMILLCFGIDTGSLSQAFKISTGKSILIPLPKARNIHFVNSLSDLPYLTLM